MIEQFFEAVKPYGIGGLLLVLVFWMMKRQYDNMDKREARTATHEAAFIKSLESINNTLDAHDKSTRESQGYVRDEHREMIDVLKRINGK